MKKQLDIENKRLCVSYQLKNRVHGKRKFSGLTSFVLKPSWTAILNFLTSLYHPENVRKDLPVKIAKNKRTKKSQIIQV